MSCAATTRCLGAAAFSPAARWATRSTAAIERVVGYLRWIAGVCILGLFFGGIVAATAGRLWDHHGSGRLGARLIVGSLALALLFGLGYTLVSQFAASTA